MSSHSAFRSYLFIWVFALLLDLARLSLFPFLSVFPLLIPHFPFFSFPLSTRWLLGTVKLKAHAHRGMPAGHPQEHQSLGGSKEVKAMDFPHCSGCSEAEHFMSFQHKLILYFNHIINHLCCYTAPNPPSSFLIALFPSSLILDGSVIILLFYAPLHALHTLWSFHKLRPGCLTTFLLMH